MHTSLDVERALRSRGRDLLVVDPDVAPADASTMDPAAPGPAVAAWLRVHSSRRVADLLTSGAAEVLYPRMGADEVTARLRRLLDAPRPAARPVSFAGLTVDARLADVRWNGKTLDLTPREAEVLQVLVAVHGGTARREHIYRQVWRWTMPRGDRTVDVNIRRLRTRLRDQQIPVRVTTVAGVGYRLEAAAFDGVAVSDL